MRSDLRADCAHCFALCCVSPAFAASADFAITKPAGQPCPHLQTDFRCGIHADLRARGFRGCAVYDCFGAGQKVSQITFGGAEWRRSPHSAQPMFAVFQVMRQLHELLWYLTEALRLQPVGPLHDELRRALDETEHLTFGSPGALLALDVAAQREAVNALLRRTSAHLRAGIRHKKDYAGADLIGTSLTGANLKGASLRGALLIGADLRGADLTLADFTGADCRDADLRGTDLAASLFLIQSQLDAARGDAATRVPPSLSHPPQWERGSTNAHSASAQLANELPGKEA